MASRTGAKRPPWPRDSTPGRTLALDSPAGCPSLERVADLQKNLAALGAVARLQSAHIPEAIAGERAKRMTSRNPKTGNSAPLGATVTPDGVNFSVFSKHATRIELLLFDARGRRAPSRVIRLEPTRHRTYHYWHVLRARPRARARSTPTARTGRSRRSAACASTREKVLLDPYGRAVAVPAAYDRAAAARPGRQRGHGDEERGGRPGALRLGGRRAAAPPVRRHGHLRDARARLHAPSQLGRGAGQARHLRRPDREDPVPAGPRRHGRRAAAGLPVRPARRAARAASTTGATSRSRSSRRTTPTARGRTRSARSTSSATW